jgi:3-methylcrotonyl-CoA carboxylase alpha subunit
VIEEAPAPGMDAETREAVCGAAVRAAKAVNYENAGTIEFIADASEGLRADRIWFMEMNTRLQVEHPVTEEITGQDLVEWQLRVASGEKLPKKQSELSINGHAIEARLYAEDPAKGFLPSVGTLERFFPRAPEKYAVRFDLGFETGDVISPNYDPMLGKFIAKGEDRKAAIEALVWGCRWTTVWPIRTNLGFVMRCLQSEDFQSGDVDTGFIERHFETLTHPDLPLDAMAAYAADEIICRFDTPLPALNGFRLNADPRAQLQLIDDQGLRYTADLIRGAWHGFTGDDVENGYLIDYEGEYRIFYLFEPRGTGTTHGLHDGEIEAPMPGKVTAVEVKKGEKVTKGQRLLTLEAMKMEHALTAPFDGTVAELSAKAGAQVSEGQLLVKVQADDPTS